MNLEDYKAKQRALLEKSNQLNLEILNTKNTIGLLKTAHISIEKMPIVEQCLQYQEKHLNTLKYNLDKHQIDVDKFFKDDENNKVSLEEKNASN